MSDDYAPFPESALQQLCDALLDGRARVLGDQGGDWSHEALADIQNALAAHAALRNRCLRAELALNHGVTEGAN